MADVEIVKVYLVVFKTQMDRNAALNLKMAQDLGAEVHPMHNGHNVEAWCAKPGNEPVGWLGWYNTVGVAISAVDALRAFGLV